MLAKLLELKTRIQIHYEVLPASRESEFKDRLSKFISVNLFSAELVQFKKDFAVGSSIYNDLFRSDREYKVGEKFEYSEIDERTGICLEASIIEWRYLTCPKIVELIWIEVTGELIYENWGRAESRKYIEASLAGEKRYFLELFNAIDNRMKQKSSKIIWN